MKIEYLNSQGEFSRFNGGVAFFLFLCCVILNLDAWTPPAQVTLIAVNAHYPVVLLNDNNEGGAFWFEGYAPSTELYFSSYDVLLDSWSAKQAVTIGSGTFQNLSAAIDGSGNIAVVWQDMVDPENVTSLYVYKPAAGSFTIPVVFSGSSLFRAPVVKLFPEGEGAVVWQDENTNTIESSYISDLGVLGGINVLSSTAGNLLSPRLSLNSLNNGLSIWGNRTNGALYSAFSLNGSWEPEQTVTAVGNNSDPRVALSNNDFSLAIWLDGDTENIFSASRPSLGSWSGSTQLTTLGNSHSPFLGIDDNDNGVAIWVQEGNIEALTYDGTGGAWIFPVTQISTALINLSCRLSINSAGDGWAIWTNVTDETIEVAPYGFVPGWGALQTISTGAFNGNPSIAVNVTGQALAAWIQQDPVAGTWAVMASFDDAP